VEKKPGSERRPFVALFAIYRVSFWIGAFSFGGGLTAWVHREVVETRRWMEADEFLSGLAVSQVLPGVNSTNLAIFIGQRLRGARGALTALLAMLTAPFAFVILAALSYEALLSVPAIQLALVGMAAAALGMLLRMGIVSARTSLRSIRAAVVTIATFLGVGVLQWPIFAVLAVVVPLSVAAAWPRDRADA
jgi:chromate transporter